MSIISNDINTEVRKSVKEFAQKEMTLNLSFYDQESAHGELAPASCSLPHLPPRQAHPALCRASEQTRDAAEDPAADLR